MYLANRLKRLAKFITFTLLLSISGGVIVTLIFPLAYRSEIITYSETYDLDPFLVASIIRVESSYDRNAISNRGARGLMQIGPTTGAWAADVLEIDNYTADMLFDPELNIRFGSWYLRQLEVQFDGNLKLILAAYNAGSGNVTNWLIDRRYSQDGKNLTKIPFKETENYVQRVQFNYEVYSLFYKNYIYKENNVCSLYFDIVILLREYLSKIYNYIT